MLLEIIFIVCTLLATIIAVVGDAWPPGGRAFGILVCIDLIVVGIKLFG